MTPDALIGRPYPLEVGPPGDPFTIHSVRRVETLSGVFSVMDITTAGESFASMIGAGDETWLTADEAAQLGLSLLRAAGHMRARK